MSDSLFDITGRVALVTGGGTHLGKAMAEALASHGADTFVAGRRRTVIEETAADLRSRGLSCHAVAMDVTDPVAVEAAVDHVISEAGSLDVMVCNAGAGFEESYPPHTDIDDFRSTLESHLIGSLNCANAAARHMLPKGEGSIITVASIHGFLTADPRLYEGIDMKRRSGPAYQSAKAGVLALTRNLAAELGRGGIRVNCISPGQMPKDTANPTFVERARDRNALGIIGKPEHIKGAVVLLASDAGAFITGHNLVVDGGWSIW